MYSENDWVWDGIASLIPAWNFRPSSTLQAIPLARIRTNLSRFLANVRRVQIQVPHRTLPGREARQACMDDLSTLLVKCVPEKLGLILVLSHPVHQGAGLSTFLASRLWRDQELILRCLMAGLQARRLREFAVSFKRKHFEVDDYSGTFYRVNCHIGKLLDGLEIKIEDDLGKEHPPSHLRTLGASRVPVKTHSHLEWEYGNSKCPLCGDYPYNRLLYHS